MNLLLILAAIFPGLFICFLIYFLDKHEKEEKVPLLITFVLGILSGLPAIGIQMLAAKIGLDSTANFGFLLIYVFIVVAFSEELVKIIMLMAYPFPRPFFNEPMDGIVYSMMVGMGFAVIENIIYAYNYGIETILVRAFTAVPAHAIFAVFMGYFVGLAKFHPTNKWKLIIFGFTLAIFIHGLYDFFIVQQYYEWLMAFGLVTIIIGGYLAWLLIKDHRENSPFKATTSTEVLAQEENSTSGRDDVANG